MTTTTNTKRLEPLDRDLWGTLVKNPNRFAVWTSSEFSVQAFNVPSNIVRLAINRNKRIPSPRLFADGISWEDIQAIKDECGYADRMAVEIYPEAKHILNIVNARHLWILPDPLPFAWRFGDGCINIKGNQMDRAEHIQWCKDRAIEYVRVGEYDAAISSMLSDLIKHPETCNLIKTTETINRSLVHAPPTEEKIRQWIKGFN